MRRDLLIRGGAVVGLLLCLLSLGTYLTVRHGLYHELDHSLQQTAALLSNQMELENGRITSEWQEGIDTNHALIDEGLFQYRDETTGKTTRSPGMGSRDLPQFCGTDGAPLIRDIQLPGTNRQARAIGMRVFPYCLPEESARMKAEGRDFDPLSYPHLLVVARDMKPVNSVLTRMRWILSTGTLLTLLIGFAMIDRVVRRSLRPIDQLTRQVRERSGNQIDAALDVPGELPSELTEMAEDFDSLLARVAAIRQRERDFIRHAAHELRTPIAGLQATLDLALSKRRDADEYVKHLETCRKMVAETGQLVKRLSSLARIGNTPHATTREPVDLEKLTEECLDRFLPALARRQIRPTINKGSGRRRVAGDEALLRIILNNLLDNIVSHAPSGSEFRIGFEYTADSGRMLISNPATGLPEDPERLFEPLFRRHAAGDTGNSHLGIGLTLSLDAAHAMDGSLTASRTPEGWLQFCLRLPVAD